jgi:hypothetical protein
MVWIWQHNKRTDDCKIILNLRKKIDEKEARKGPNFKKLTVGQKSENRRKMNCKNCEWQHPEI